MAHFAELDASGNVLRVIVVADPVIMVDGAESEQAGIDFCRSLFGAGTTWKQTSYNASKRAFYAGPGAKYESALDAFVPAGYTADIANRKIVPPSVRAPDGKTVTPAAIDVLATVDAVKE